MVAVFSGLVVAGLGLATESAQTAPSPTPQPQPTAPAPANDPTLTPYQAADPAAQTQGTTTTTTTTTDAPATPAVDGTENAKPVVVQPPAPLVVEQPAGPVTPVVIEERLVNVTVVPDRRARRNFALSLGGGVSDFTDGMLRDRTSVNGAYEGRLGIGLGSIFGLEAAYVGTAGSIDTLGLDDEAMLISNGVEGLARLNLGTFRVQPYVVGGSSWVRYSVVNESFNTSDVRNSDDVLAIPFGGGLSADLGNSGLLADARFTYRATFDDDLIAPTPLNSDGSSLSNWMATLRLGYTF